MTAFDGTSAHVVDFLAGEVLAAHEPELQALHAAHVGARAPVRAAVRRGDLDEPGSAAALDALARTNLFLLPLDDRRQLVPLPPPVRPDPARGARAARAGPGADAAPARVRVAQRVRHHRRGDPPRRRGARRSRRPSRADRRDVGPLRQRRPDRRRSTSGCADPRRTGDQRLLLVKAWVSALRGREADMRAAAARVRALGGLDDGPLPDGFVSLESSLVGARARRSAGATCRRSSSTATRSAELEPPDSPWRPVITWALGWAHYCNGDLDEAERWLTETTEIAPAGGAVDRRRRRDRRPLADRGHARAARRAAAARARRRSRSRATVGLLDAVEDGEVHTAYGVALAAHGRARGGAARAREGRLPAPAVGAEARPDRRPDRARERRSPSWATASGRRALFDEAEELVAAVRRRGRARRPARGGASARRGSTRAPTGDELSERELTVLRQLGERALRARDRRRALPLLQHRPQPREVDLPQARGLLARRGGRPRPRFHLGR